MSFLPTDEWNESFQGTVLASHYKFCAKENINKKKAGNNKILGCGINEDVTFKGTKTFAASPLIQIPSDYGRAKIKGWPRHE